MNVELALRVFYMLGEVITDKVSRFGKLELIVMCFPSLLTCIHHDNCTLYAHDVHKYHSLTPLSKEHPPSIPTFGSTFGLYLYIKETLCYIHHVLIHSCFA